MHSFPRSLIVPFLVALLFSPALVRADYQSEVLADAPLVFYRCDESSGTTANNLGTLGAAANGTYSDAGVTLGQTAALDGLGAAVALSGGFIRMPALGVGPVSQLTVELWVKRNLDPPGFFALSAGDGFETGDLHLNLVGAGPQVEFAVSGNSGFPRFSPTWAVGEWTHLVVTYDIQGGAGQVRMYLNGVLLGQAATGATPVQFNGDQLGAWLNTFEPSPVSQRFLEGCLDEVAIYGTVLSAERVRAHYNAVATGVAISTHPQDVLVLEGRPATFSVVATGPNPQYQWFKNGQPIAGANRASYTTPPTVLTDDGAIFFVQVSNTVNSVSSSDAILTVVERPTGTYAETVLADLPLVYYQMNEPSGATTANSGSLGGAADGTLSGAGAQLAQPSASSALGTALDLNGLSGFVRVPDLGQGGLARTSVELWLKRRGTPAPFHAIYAGDGFESGDLHLNLFNGGPLLEFAIADNPGFPRFGPSWSEGEWTHLVVTYDTASGQVQFYLNGALFGQAAAGATAIHFNGGQIGAWLNTFANPAVSQRFLNGVIDEFAVYGEVLTPAQVLRHYVASAPPPPPYAAAVLADAPLVFYRLDETNRPTAENLGSIGPAGDGLYAETGVAQGGPSAFPGLGLSAALDGASGFVRVPNLNLGPMTATSVELWLKLRSNPGSLQAVFAGDGFEPGDLHYNLVDAAPSVEFAVSGNSGFPRFTSAWAIGEWHHLVFTYTSGAGSKVRVYVDAALVGEADTTGTPIHFAGGQIGAWLNTFVGPAQSQRFLDASIDEFAVYATALTPERIRAHYGAIETRPAITAQPGDAIVIECHPATFRVSATGPNLTYQWFKNGSPIFGATAASYATPPVALADDGAVFTVAVSNVVAAVTSSNAVLRVVTQPGGDYASTVLGDTPLVFYRFNETGGATAANAGSLGNAADGALAGGATLGHGAAFPGLGSALDLDGASGFVRVPDLGQAGLAQASVELWLKRRGTPAPFYAIYAGDGFESGDLHLNLVDGGPLLEFAIADNPGFPRFGPSWSEGEWTHLVVTYDTASGQVQFYLNGALFGQAAAGATAIHFNGGQIGAWLNTFANPAVSQRFLNGVIDEFAVYGGVLTPAQVLRHHAATASAELTVSRAGNQLTLSWVGCGFVLQENTDVANPAGWANVPNGATSPVPVTISGAAKFFRLAR